MEEIIASFSDLGLEINREEAQLLLRRLVGCYNGLMRFNISIRVTYAFISVSGLLNAFIAVPMLFHIKANFNYFRFAYSFTCRVIYTSMSGLLTFISYYIHFYLRVITLLLALGLSYS